jgi:hypothetical protein
MEGRRGWICVLERTGLHIMLAVVIGTSSAIHTAASLMRHTPA